MAAGAAIAARMLSPHLEGAPAPDTAMALNYSEDRLLRWLDTWTLEKGSTCLPAVLTPELRGTHLHAQVQGTAPRPYDVLIDLGASTRGGNSRLHAVCSCPVGKGCKHIAAVLMFHMRASLQFTADDMFAPKPLDTPVRPEVLMQLSSWQSEQRQPEKKSQKVGIAFEISTLDHRVIIDIRRTRYDAKGAISFGKLFEFTAQMLLAPPPYLSQRDLAVLVQLWSQRQVGKDAMRMDVALTLELIVSSGNGWVHCDPHGRVPARMGAPRRGELVWKMAGDDASASASPALSVDGGAQGGVWGNRACYVDPVSGEVGPLELDVRTEDADAFLDLPTLLPTEVPVVAQLLQQINPGLPRPGTAEGLATLQTGPMVPVLRLHTLEFRPPWLSRREPSQLADVATVAFEYDDHVRFLDDPNVFVHDAKGELALLPRDLAEEARRERELRSVQMSREPQTSDWLADAGPLFRLNTRDWTRFLLDDVPRLEALGWRVEPDDDFRHRLTVVDDIELDIQPSPDGENWFALGLDIRVEDRQVPLAPLLQQLLETDPRWLRGGMSAIDDDENILLLAGDHTRVAFRAGRLKPVIALLGDLFNPQDSTLRVSNRDRGRLRALQDDARLRFKDRDDTRVLVQRLLDNPAPPVVIPPKGLQATLRPYQREGLAWLQYLRQHDLGGILADDMGLGKTLQTLAHILLEKEQGRLQQPALVVVPTSLLHNWQSEAARFAPDLRVLALHGNDRSAGFERIGEHDLVLTTYPLLWRDEEALQAHDYHLVILDEAQQVKNAKSRAAVTLRTLRARHRLCLTGTPLENHLGEIWTHFDFLLPGLLGSEKQFNQHWRHPIERGHDAQRAQLLAKRVRPFLLRRRKDQVATELPPKTEITRLVPLEGAQRDLYETVRASMEEKVREALASSGLQRSHIVVLDALLKLRQVCCDPRLLPGRATGPNAPSAKLELLRTLLPEMVEEGRRILLFSQFTSMLALIAQLLEELGLPYVQLTGDTQDRATPVQRFMQGEVPIFLISLKAGGVGLNLTAADTVIHFDPWWNPAAERQATDRAHRIGQQQPVFVYRLIAAGSIEERITELQQRKSALADTLLEGAEASSARFSEADLEALLAPLPGAPAKKRAARRSRVAD